jgi:hypothetical protein
MSASNPCPIVTEVVRFEDLPPGSRGTRRAIARRSDGRALGADAVAGLSSEGCAPDLSADTPVCLESGRVGTGPEGSELFQLGF